MRNIMVEADEVWGYFQQNKDELRNNAHVIAENDEFGVEITIAEEFGFPYIVVTADGYQYTEEYPASKSDCSAIVRELYDTYLTERFFVEEEEETRFDQEDSISERELELDEAIMCLLEVILEEDPAMLGANADTICDDIKEHILEYLARKYALPIRRPMVLEDADTGEEFLSEYPYSCMVFDDINHALPTPAI